MFLEESELGRPADVGDRSRVSRLGLANRETCAGYIEKSLALVTGLVPEIGYDKAAAIAKKAYESGKTIREVAVEENILSPDKIDDLLSR